MGLPRKTFRGERKIPLGPGLPKCLWWNVLRFLRCKPLVSLCLAGVTTSIWWDFSPMEVRTNHLPICTCLSGMVLQQKKVHPSWDHKSQGSSQFQSHLIIKLPKHVHRTPLYLDKCSKTLCSLTSQVWRGSLLMFRSLL